MDNLHSFSFSLRQCSVSLHKYEGSSFHKMSKYLSVQNYKPSYLWNNSAQKEVQLTDLDCNLASCNYHFCWTFPHQKNDSLEGPSQIEVFIRKEKIHIKSINRWT